MSSLTSLALPEKEPEKELENELKNELEKELQSALQRTLPMARLEQQQLPGCRGLTLALINADFPTGPLPGEVMHAVVARPAYWAFCWGSGLALARYLLDYPELVAGQRVLDLGSGSGVAGIAAAMAGASEVVACDTDRDAQLATRFNANLNDVSLTLTTQITNGPKFDRVLMADVLYDKSNLPLLALAQSVSRQTWVADSRIDTLDNPDFELQAERSALTLPNLGEFDEFGTTRIWRAVSGHNRSGEDVGEDIAIKSNAKTP